MFGIDGALEISRACRSMGYLSIDSEEDRRLIQLSTLRKRLLMSLSGVLALGLAMSCSSAETSVEPDATPVSAAADTEELADSEYRVISVEQREPGGLPPGVMPPTGENPPGAARLGTDGHYDYSAEDFELGNPCDDPEIVAKVESMGHVFEPFEYAKFKGFRQSGCIFDLSLEGNGSVNRLWYQAVNYHILVRDNGDPRVIERDGLTWYVSRQEDPGVMVACVASIETERGSFGFVIDVTEALSENADFHTETCAEANEIFYTFFKGD